MLALRHASSTVDRSRTLRRVLVTALLLLLALPALLPAPARAVPPESVLVSDTTGSLDEGPLAERLAVVDFRREVRLVVLVLDVTEHGASPSRDTALNDAVLDRARTDDRSLLSADGSVWADGTVILALDPENRFLGTYAGEDVKLDEDGFEAVQEAMREPARGSEWSEAIEAGAEKYADLLDRPWWQHPAALLVAAVAAVGAAIAVLSTLGLRSRARRRTDLALPRHDEVLAQRAVTDAAARTLPELSPYARAAVLAHESYAEGLAEAERLRAELPAPQERGWAWGLRGGERSTAARFARVVETLDDTDDDILAAADLLHRMGQWRSAWERELEPLRDSLEALEEVRSRREG
jgi:uncharacterized membrane protein YgcG